jgi:hypothetical protein
LPNKITSAAVEMDANITAPLSPGATDASAHGTVGGGSTIAAAVNAAVNKRSSAIFPSLMFTVIADGTRQQRPIEEPASASRSPIGHLNPHDAACACVGPQRNATRFISFFAGFQTFCTRSSQSKSRGSQDLRCDRWVVDVWSGREPGTENLLSTVRHTTTEVRGLSSSLLLCNRTHCRRVSWLLEIVNFD